MTLEAGLFTHLTGHTGLSALVSTRVYPLVMPQGATFPLLVYSRVSTPRLYSQSGPSGLANPRMQIDCWGKSYGSVKDTAAQVLAALSGFRGMMGNANTGGAFSANETDLRDPETGLYRVSMDFIIWHYE